MDRTTASLRTHAAMLTTENLHTTIAEWRDFMTRHPTNSLSARVIAVCRGEISNRRLIRWVFFGH